MVTVCAEDAGTLLPMHGVVHDDVQLEHWHTIRITDNMQELIVKSSVVGRSMIRAGIQQTIQVGICAHPRLRSDCAYAQSDLSL